VQRAAVTFDPTKRLVKLKLTDEAQEIPAVIATVSEAEKERERERERERVENKGGKGEGM